MTQLYNTFNIGRFKNLCRLTIAERWKRDSLGALLLFILSVIITYFVFRFSEHVLSQLEGGEEDLNKVNSLLLDSSVSQILSFSLALIGALYILSFLKELSPKHPRTSTYLMLPVSAFERISSVFLFASLSYTIVAAFLLIIGINVGIFVAGSGIEAFDFSFIPIFKGRYIHLFSTVLIVQQIYLVGAFYFRKSCFMKTTLVFLLILAIYQFADIFFIALFTKIASPVDSTFVELFGASTLISSQAYALGGLDKTILYSNLLIIPILCIFFWAFAYFKIKEKEIK